MRGLEGKRVVVTGGARGIGAATVERFRAEGAAVTVLDLDPGDAGVRVDVSDGDAVRDAFTDLGPVDVVVSNAGVSERGLRSISTSAAGGASSHQPARRLQRRAGGRPRRCSTRAEA